MRSYRSSVSLFLALALAACGGREVVEVPVPVERSKATVSSQDSSLCSAIGNAVYKFTGGPGGDGCTCASVRAVDRGTNVATLKLLLPNGLEEIRSGVVKGSGLGQYHDTWVLANCP